MDQREVKMSVAFVMRPCMQLTHGLSFIERMLHFFQQGYCPEMAVSLLGYQMQMTVLFSHIRLGILQAKSNIYLFVLSSQMTLFLCFWSHSFEEGSLRIYFVCFSRCTCIHIYTHRPIQYLAYQVIYLIIFRLIQHSL